MTVPAPVVGRFIPEIVRMVVGFPAPFGAKEPGEGPGCES